MQAAFPFCNAMDNIWNIKSVSRLSPVTSEILLPGSFKNSKPSGAPGRRQKPRKPTAQIYNCGTSRHIWQFSWQQPARLPSQHRRQRHWHRTWRMCQRLFPCNVMSHVMSHVTFLRRVSTGWWTHHQVSGHRRRVLLVPSRLLLSSFGEHWWLPARASWRSPHLSCYSLTKQD